MNADLFEVVILSPLWRAKGLAFRMCSAMESSMRLDEVSIFGDKLSFLIPHEWVEGEGDDDHYLYHEPQADSGWLRVSLITVRTDDPELKLRKLFADCVDVF